MNRLRTCCLTIVCLAFALPSWAQDKPTSRELRQVRTIATALDKAGRYYQLERFETCKGQVEKAQRLIEQLAQDADAELLKLLKPEHERLANAHRLLKEQGIELSELMPLPAPMVANGDAVSFRDAIAPFLVNRCGRCHVRRNRGSFSAATYQALMDSTHVSPGMADESRIVEVIVDGDMPPNGSIPPAELEQLKQWIAQGAPFDGDRPDQNLLQLTGMENANRQPPTIARPSGNETVSFSLHAAPILVDNCAGCHIDMRNPRGNLSMASFVRLLGGGDSGPPIVPGEPDNSVLVQRIKGIDSDVMPPNRKLTDRDIRTIETWIAEGAAYDGNDDGTDAIRDVVERARASAQSHEQLTRERDQLASDNWKLVMSDVPPKTLTTANFRWYSTTTPERLEQIGQRIEELLPELADALKADPQQPWVKGNATVYVFERRYDFNELGQMLVGRPMPDHASTYWSYSPIDAYAATLLTRNQTPEEVVPEIARQVAALHVAQLAPDVPRWFASGAGYWAAARALQRHPRIKAWEEAAETARRQQSAPGDFANGRLADEDAALVGYLFVQQLRSDSGKLHRLLRELRKGNTFDQAFQSVMGAPVDQYFGQSSDRPNRRGRRNR